MSNVIFSEKDKRVVDIINLIESPGFKYIDKFFDDKIKYEDLKIQGIIKSPIENELLRSSLNRHILRKQILEELKNSFKDSLEEYTKLSESEFTDSSGAKY